jgi:hypothetical protein
MKNLSVRLTTTVATIAVLLLLVIGFAGSAGAHTTAPHVLPLLPDRLEPSLFQHVVSSHKVLDVARYRCNPDPITGYTFASAKVRIALFEGDVPGPDAVGYFTPLCNGKTHLAALLLNDADGDVHVNPLLSTTDVGTMTLFYTDNAVPPHDFSTALQLVLYASTHDAVI